LSSPSPSKTKTSPLSAVREIGLRFDKEEATEKEKEFVLLWQQKFSDVSLDIDASLQVLYKDVMLPSSSSSSTQGKAVFIFNGFLEHLSHRIHQNKMIKTPKDKREEGEGEVNDKGEGGEVNDKECNDQQPIPEPSLNCVELAFEFHTRLKHLVPRAKLLGTIFAESGTGL